MMSTISDLNLLRPAFTRGAEAKMPPKVKGGILQVCLNLNQSEVGFHRVNLLNMNFPSVLYKAVKKHITSMCHYSVKPLFSSITNLWNQWNILLSMNKPIVMNFHLMMRILSSLVNLEKKLLYRIAMASILGKIISPKPAAFGSILLGSWAYGAAAGARQLSAEVGGRTGQHLNHF